MTAAGQSPAASLKRTVSFFRLVVQQESGQLTQMKNQPWQNLLATVASLKVKDRTYEGPTRRLIGEVLTVDGEYALKIMEPRDEHSWLEILKAEEAAADFNPDELGVLVETSIVAFLPKKNLFGIIRGSTSSPTHTAVAEWLDHLKIKGKTLLDSQKLALRAEPALSQRQKQLLDSSGGVSKASVRISTNKAQQLAEVGSEQLAASLRSLKETYGDIFVTITLKVPRGKQYDEARTELKKEAQRLQKVAGDAESVSATLVHYDAEQRARQEDVDFVSQRITTSKGVPLVGEDGSPIRNSSAVRAILSAVHDLQKELDSVV